MIEDIVKTKYAGAGWLKRNLAYVKPDMVVSELGEKVADILGQVFSGIYHIEDRSLFKVDWSRNHSIQITLMDNGFATYDAGCLTHLVLLAHLCNIRVAVTAATHGYLKLTFMRVSVNTTMGDRHPNLKENIERYFKDAGFVFFGGQL